MKKQEERLGLHGVFGITLPPGTWCVLLALCLLIGADAFAQNPVFTVRLANPRYDCDAATYCVDVEFQSNTPNQRLFGMNVRFFVTV